jgi:CTD small phosphatase-like protein 2
MDETLLHSSLTPFPLGADPRSVDDHMDALAERKSKQESSRMKKPEHCFTIHEDGQQQERIRSVMRPGLREFLLAISAEFEPILFTSAMSIYARPLLDLVEGPAPGEASVTVPGEAPIPAELHPVFRHRLYREATVPAQEIDYGYVKDIRLLGRDMRRTILVDNSWHACVHAPDNCIIVPDYLGSSDDQVFKPLLALLREAATHEDVRPYLRAKLRFREQLEKQGLKFKGMPKEGKDITLEEEQKQHRN